MATESWFIERVFYLPTQGMRVFVRVNPGKNWELEGIPAEAPEKGDEVLNSQTELLAVYEEFNLYTVDVVDRVMGAAEQLFGRFLNTNRKRDPWKRTGNYPTAGEADL